MMYRFLRESINGVSAIVVSEQLVSARVDFGPRLRVAFALSRWSRGSGVLRSTNGKKGRFVHTAMVKSPSMNGLIESAYGP